MQEEKSAFSSIFSPTRCARGKRKHIESHKGCRQFDAMKRATAFAIVLVTAPNLKTARHLAQLALKARLIACANLVPKVESHYWWQGRLEAGAEVLMVLKTRNSHLGRLEKLILGAHPYDTPEFLVLGLHSGSQRFLDWLAASC